MKLFTDEFNEKNISTIGIEIKTFDLNLDVYNKEGKTENKKFYISLIDTAGQERYKSITTTYFKGTDGIFLIYDITNRAILTILNHGLKVYKIV